MFASRPGLLASLAHKSIAALIVARDDKSSGGDHAENHDVGDAPRARRQLGNHVPREHIDTRDHRSVDSGVTSTAELPGAVEYGVSLVAATGEPALRRVVVGQRQRGQRCSLNPANGRPLLR